MNRRCVQRARRTRDAQEPGRLFERFWTETGHVEQCLTARERAVRVAPGNDVFRQQGAQAGYPGQQGGGGGIEVDTHGIDAVFNDGIERARQLALVDVMLILTDAYGLGLDLDQFRSEEHTSELQSL